MREKILRKLNFSFDKCLTQSLDFVFWEKKIRPPEKLALLQNYGFELNLKFDVETSDHFHVVTMTWMILEDTLFTNIQNIQYIQI